MPPRQTNLRNNNYNSNFISYNDVNQITDDTTYNITYKETITYKITNTQYVNRNQNRNGNRNQNRNGNKNQNRNGNKNQNRNNNQHRTQNQNRNNNQHRTQNQNRKNTNIFKIKIQRENSKIVFSNNKNNIKIKMNKSPYNYFTKTIDLFDPIFNNIQSKMRRGEITDFNKLWNKINSVVNSINNDCNHVTGRFSPLHKMFDYKDQINYYIESC